MAPRASAGGKGRGALHLVTAVGLGLVVLTLVLLDGTLACLRSSWGSDYLLRHVLLPRVNAVILGRVSASRLEWRGGRITLHGLGLHDPGGRPVATVARVDVRLRPWSLLRRRVAVASLRIVRPSLSLRETPTGPSNLARALANRRPAAGSPPPAPSGGGSSWAIEIGALALVDGAASVESRPDDASPPTTKLRLADVGLTAAARWNEPDVGGIGLSVQAQAQVREPIRLPLQVRSDAAGFLGTSPSLDGNLEVALGASTLRLTAKVRPNGPRPQVAPERAADLDLTITRLEVEPSLARALVPAWRLGRPLSGTGAAHWQGATESAQANLELAAGSARISATASGSARGALAGELRLHARALDLAALDESWPSSRLRLDLAAQGGRPADGWRGSATVDLPPGTLGGRAMGAVHARVAVTGAQDGEVELRGALPGTTVGARGRLVRGRLSGYATLDVHDLALTVAGLTKRGARPEAAGHGQAKLVLAGTLATPALEATANFQGLRWRDIEVPELRLVAHLPNLRQPLAARGHLLVPSARLGPRRLRGLACRVRGEPGRFDGSLVLAEPRLGLAVAGPWRRAGEALRLDRATLEVGRERFRLAHPARLGWQADRFQLAGLTLTARDGQSLRLAVDKDGSRLDVHLAASGLLLERLPDFLQPRGVRLGGRLTADLRVRERNRARQVEGQVALASGRIGPIADITLAAGGHFADGRISGQLRLTSATATLDGRFALPAAWPPPPAAPLEMDLTVARLALEPLAGWLGLAPPAPAASPAVPMLRGEAGLRLRLWGTARDPRLVLRADLRRGDFRGIPIGDVALTASAEERVLHASLHFARSDGMTAGVGQGDLSLDVHSSLGELVRRARARQRLGEIAMGLQARVAALDLGWLAAATRLPRKLGGTLALSAQADGTLDRPRGQLDVTLGGVSTAGIPPTDGELHARLGEGEGTITAVLTRRGAALLSATARLHGSPAAWRHPATLGDEPVSVHATVGPIEFQHDGTLAGPGLAGRRVLQGKARAEADLEGSLHRPRLHARAQLSELRLDGKPVGEGELTVAYAGRELRGDLHLASAGGGELRGDVRFAGELGYPEPSALSVWRRAPLAARLDASGFDLGVLSGAVSGLPSVSGRLFANLRVDGSLADPRPSGRLEWKDGGLTVTGMGDYRNVHLVVTGDPEHIKLEELEARSGGGRARVTGEGTHQPSGGYHFAARVDISKLPVYVEGQALAALSLDASAQATSGAGSLRSSIAIRSARVALEDVKRKHLQALAVPADIVLVEDGRPIDPAQARKLAALEAAWHGGAERPAVAQPKAERSPVAAPAARVVLLLEAPNDLWVSGNDVNLELGLEPGFRVEVAAEPRVYGRVLIKRGRVDVLGRRFDLKQGSSLLFSGPADAPELDVSAQYKNGKENITVVASVKGDFQHLQTTLISPERPDLTESQLYTLVVTGRLISGGGTASASTPAAQTKTILGGVLAGQLQKLVAKNLPFDVLTIEGGATAGSARLEAGKYVTANLYVGYVGRWGADPVLLQNRNAVHLEYDLGSHWSFQGEYGDAKTGSADVMWTKRY